MCDSKIEAVRLDDAIKALEAARTGGHGRLFNDLPILKEKFADIFEKQDLDSEYNGLAAYLGLCADQKHWTKTTTDLNWKQLIYLAISRPDGCDIVYRHLDSLNERTALAACLLAEALLNRGELESRPLDQKVVVKTAMRLLDSPILGKEKLALVRLVQRLAPRSFRRLFRQFLLCIRERYGLPSMLEAVTEYEMSSVADWAIRAALADRNNLSDRGLGWVLHRVLIIMHRYYRNLSRNTLQQAVKTFVDSLVNIGSEDLVDISMYFWLFLDVLDDDQALKRASVAAILEVETPGEDKPLSRYIVQLLKTRARYDAGLDCSDDLQKLDQAAAMLQRDDSKYGRIVYSVYSRLLIRLSIRMGQWDRCCDLLQQADERFLWNVVDNLYFDIPLERLIDAVQRMDKRRQSVVLHALMAAFSRLGCADMEAVAEAAMSSATSW